MGYELKEILKAYLPELGLGYEVVDMGADAYHEGDDYPDFVMPVAKKVAEDRENHLDSMGIVVGGSGQGEAMCANKLKGIRALVFYGQENPKAKVSIDGEESTDTFEIVKLAREHNDANIISIGARFVTVDEAKFAIELFLNTPFNGEERHVRRINKF